MPEQESLTFSLTVRAVGLLITALVVLVIAFCMQLTLRLLSWGQLSPELPVLAYTFAFYILSLFLTVGTRQRPAHAPFLLANLALHLGFLVLGWLLFASQLPALWLAGVAACWTIVLVGDFGFDRLIQRAVSALLQPGVQGSEPLVQRCFFVDTPVHHALPIGAALGTLYGALLGDAQPLVTHMAAGAAVALTLVELRGLSAGARLLASEPVASHEHAGVVLAVDTSHDRGRLQALAPAPSTPTLAAQSARLARGIRAAHLLGQLRRMLVVSLGVLVVWHLELTSVPSWLVASALLLLGLASGPLPFVRGQRATLRRLQQSQAHAPLDTKPLPGLSSWALLAAALLLGALAFACLAPLSALAARL